MSLVHEFIIANLLCFPVIIIKNLSLFTVVLFFYDFNIKFQLFYSYYFHGITFYHFTLKYIFIILFLAALGLLCCQLVFSSFGEWYYSLAIVSRLLTMVSSLDTEFWLLSTVSVAAVHRLSYLEAYGIFLDQ